MYNKLKTAQLKDVVPAEMIEYVPELPDTGLSEQVSGVCQTVGETRENFWEYYNRGVMASTDGVINLPQTLQSYGNQALEWVQEQAK